MSYYFGIGGEVWKNTVVVDVGAPFHQCLHIGTTAATVDVDRPTVNADDAAIATANIELGEDVKASSERTNTKAALQSQRWVHRRTLTVQSSMEGLAEMLAQLCHSRQRQHIWTETGLYFVLPQLSPRHPNFALLM